jgi:hypothetical protein
MSAYLDPNLLEFATDRQREIIEACKAEGSQRAAAAKLGISESTIRSSLRGLKSRAARQGYSPEHDMSKVCPEGFAVKGTSTLYNDQGEKVIQWVKTDRSKEDLEQLMEAVIEGLRQEIPAVKAVKPPCESLNEDLLNLFVLTDYHLGAYAWGQETLGDNWNLQIAEDLMIDWFAHAIDAAPKAKTALFAQLGDFLHWDGWAPVTPTSGHQLDGDGRFPKVATVAVRVIRRVMEMLLRTHDHVHAVMAEGNHDLASSVWLRVWLADLYRDEPRVTVDTSPYPYYVLEHGSTSLFFHHGHLRKPGNIDHVFAGQFREIFGRTKHSYAHLGHLHHDKVLETNLMTVEQHRTLAPKDSYAARGGWLADRGSKVIVYHRDHGEVGRVIITPEMVNVEAA